MTKCDNCDITATYIVDNIWSVTQNFCEEHLPHQYNKKRLPEYVTKVTPAENIVVTEEVKPKRTKKVVKS